MTFERNEARRALIAAIYETAKERSVLTINDVARRAPATLLDAARFGAVGGCFVTARRRGIIEQTGGYIPTRGKRDSHSARVIWRSLVSEAA